MSTIYMSQLSTALPLMEGDHHHQGHFQAFTLPKNPPSLFPFVISNSNPSDSGLGGGYGSDHHHLRQQHHAMLDQPRHMIGGSSSVFAPPPPFPTVESIRDDMIERSSPFEPYNIEKLHAAAGSAKDAGKWSTTAASAPGKMRIMRKASDPGVGGPAAKKPRKRAQAYEDYGHNSGAMNQALGVIRVCSDCSTTKTPLWRSGPRGPKSLCNACGIRQRKARRAMMASGVAAASTDGGPKAAPAPGDAAAAAAVHPKVKKEKIRVDVDRSLPFKKRCKVVQDHTAANTTAAGAAPVEAADPVAVTGAAAPARDLADSMAVKWSNGPTAAPAIAACFRPSPPLFVVQDEITDAAMLLMTLSCELVRS